MRRAILHSDLNCFYASVECLYNPQLRKRPVAVAGNPEMRHGIILAKNEIAKKFGVKTGEAIWQAQTKCPNLVLIPPNFPLYLKISKKVKKIYCEYTDLVESFGIDEAWLDVSGSTGLFGDSRKIAEDIRQRVKKEIGITVSIGNSYNKIFAKLGSDYKKPDAITTITLENFKDIVWPLPAGDLLYVGKATDDKLGRKGISTIGDIARTDPKLLCRWLGKWGDVLWQFANGYDNSPVASNGDEGIVKSIGNSMTTPRDLTCDSDAELLFYILAESVAMRMREHGFKGKTVTISVRDKNLYSFSRQAQLRCSSSNAKDISEKAIELFKLNYRWTSSIRSIGLNVTDFSLDTDPVQTDMFVDAKRLEARDRLDKTVDGLRSRFGYLCVQRGITLRDKDFLGANPKDGHTIHPYSYFK